MPLLFLATSAGSEPSVIGWKLGGGRVLGLLEPPPKFGCRPIDPCLTTTVLTHIPQRWDYRHLIRHNAAHPIF